jgi:two-component system, NtrC family, response regulator AtoC
VKQSSGCKNIFLVDPDCAFGQALHKVLGNDFVLHQIPSVDQALARIDNENLDTILVNFDALTNGGVPHLLNELCAATSNTSVAVPVIAYSWDSSSENAREAFRAGVFDCLEQPLDINKVRFALERACRRVELVRELAEARRQLRTVRANGLVGNSRLIQQVDEVARKIAEVSTTVLITGESGTGKGVVAQAIQQLSDRASMPFVAFSVCCFPDSLIDDELFGHERGAFTGASQTRRGRFEEANGGTIFIDEIGDLALPLQAKLLRVLQERTVERLGSNVSRPIDVRVICATNRNLEKMVDEGTFRQDLFFRISVVKIPMPPLRDRKDDIPLLAEHFLHMFAKIHKKAVRAFTPAFMSALTQHSWPGNVRELQNVIERSVVLANGNEYLGVRDLPEQLREIAACADLTTTSYYAAVHSFKQQLVRLALRRHQGNKSKAAEELGISRCYLHRLLGQLSLGEIDEEKSVDDIAEDTADLVSNARRPGTTVQVA